MASLGTGDIYKYDANGNPVEFSDAAKCEAEKCGYIEKNEILGTPPAKLGEPAKAFAFPNEPGNPAAIAIDNSTNQSDPSRGDLYVLDAGHEVIDKFAPSGQYIGQITGPFTYSPLGLGVDPSGNVRVDVKGPDPEGGTLAVEVFDDATVNGFTTLISKQLHGGQVIGTQEYYGFATAGQPGGDYPLLSCKCAARLGPNGEQYGRVDDGTTAVAVAVAVDPAGGHVYVDDQSALEHSVSEWDTGEMNGTPVVAHNEKETKSTGTFVASVGSLELMGSTEHPEQGGIAVDGATGDVYVSNPADGRVYVFGSNAPTAVVEAPANVTRTRATLHGTVNPRGVLMECRFEYNTGGSYDLTLPLAVLEHSVPCLNANGESVVDSTSPVAVHADIGVPPQAPLQPGSLYHFRLVVASANGESHGGGLFPTASAGFGFKQFEVSFLNRDGTPDVQAASHPYKMVTTVAFNTQVVPTSPTELLYSALPAGNAKDITLHLPPGFYGDPNATAKKCTLQQLAPGGLHDICPAESELGTLEAEDVAGPEPFGPTIDGKKLVNVEPPPGVAFQMAAKILAPDAFIDAGVPAGGDSGVTAVLEGIPVTVPVFRGITTIFGVPPLNPRGPLLTMPTSCNGPLTSTISGDSYQDAGHFVSAPPSVAPGMSGCAQLEFHPTLETKPDSPNASSASGLDVHVRVPQKAALNPTGLAESTLRDTTVALPPGVAINPSGGGGLEGCSEGLAGVTGSAEFNHGSEPGDKTITFTPTSLEQLEPGVSFCPDASKVGTVKVKTPLLENPLEGAVYVASQNQNPFGSLIAMYLMFEDPISGSTFKIPFKVQLCQSQGEVIGGLTCQAPGQIITTAHNTPELPFEDLELHFFGGERAPLTTPSRCGAYTTEALLTPWDGNGPVTSTSSFNIEQGPHGGPCPGTHLPFNAAFTGGSTNLQAGAFTSFTLSAIRHDGEQNVQSLRATLPPGLSGRISNIELCPEPQANEGTCPPGSLIGETTVTVGVGSHPFTVTGGKLYLTVPYNGTGGCTMHPPGGASSEPGCAPFGLTFEVPAKAGPFDLEKTAKHHPACDCVVVRGKVEIDPITSALTITTDPPGTEHAIPTMLEGIPLEVQQVNGTTTRPNFQFNPTSCAKMGLTGRLFSTEGAQDTIELPYQVTNCAALKFEPKLSVSTSGRTSKAGGASLTAKVTYPNVPQGTDADIAKVKVELPKQLPSRLTTLQKACTDKQFAANPAGCPPESKIGYAVVHTPVLPVPLQGPAIFVSHGGEAFPSLTMVLQGDNVTIDLVGTTFISKAGITSTDFKTVPDQPFSSFELTLPEGKYSALTANGNLCSSTRTVLVKRRVTVRVHGRRRTVTRKVRQTQAAPLQMPTEFVGQNGAVIRKTTKIAVTGCPKKVKKKARKASSSHRHGKGAATRG